MSQSEKTIASQSQDTTDLALLRASYADLEMKQLQHERDIQVLLSQREDEKVLLVLYLNNFLFCRFQSVLFGRNETIKDLQVKIVQLTMILENFHF
jgi:hypothetical protein